MLRLTLGGGFGWRWGRKGEEEAERRRGQRGGFEGVREEASGGIEVGGGGVEVRGERARARS